MSLRLPPLLLPLSGRRWRPLPLPPSRHPQQRLVPLPLRRSGQAIPTLAIRPRT